MKALKVLFRAPRCNTQGHLRLPIYTAGQLYSALPTQFGLGYWEDQRTTPTVGKLMVYPTWDVEAAERFCQTAREWHAGLLAADQGQMEVWRVDCHNLYRLDYLIHAGSLQHFYDQREAAVALRELTRFWRLIERGKDPVGRSDIPYAKSVSVPIWTTDWLIPRELVGIYDIHSNRWIQGVRRG